MLRVMQAISRIVQEHTGKQIVVVCHGGVIDASFLYFFRMNAFAVPPAGFDTRNTSLTCWKQILRHEKPCWVLDRYNDDAHLHGLMAEQGIDYLDQVPTPPLVPGEE
jgi:probable phosphoglycerate mutase